MVLTVIRRRCLLLLTLLLRQRHRAHDCESDKHAELYSSAYVHHSFPHPIDSFVRMLLLRPFDLCHGELTVDVLGLKPDLVAGLKPL